MNATQLFAEAIIKLAPLGPIDVSLAGNGGFITLHLPEETVLLNYTGIGDKFSLLYGKEEKFKGVYSLNLLVEGLKVLC